LAVALFGSLLVVATPIARAATLTVNAATGVDPGACYVPPSSGTYKTILKAVNCAAATDTITVAAGTYTEQVTVNKTLTLRGANTGVTGFSPRGPESIVSGPTGKTSFVVTANNVVIDGFTVQGDTNMTTFGFGILLGAGTTGHQLLNNIIQNNIAGTNLASGTLIQGNLYQNNNQSGPLSGTAIYTDQFEAGGSVTNATINNNVFTNNQNAAVELAATTASQSNIAITNNVMTGNGNGVLSTGTTGLTITGNTITGSLGSQVALGGGNNGVMILSNTIVGGSTRGIRLVDLGTGLGPEANVFVHVNRIKGNATAGIDVAAGRYTGTLDATNNFYGCNTGPNTAGCDAVTGAVLSTPYLVLNIAAAPTAVLLGQPATITADLTRNNTGQDTTVLGTIPNGTPVTFGTNLGTVMPTSTTTTAGRATAN
jgi:hypothetical protein